MQMVKARTMSIFAYDKRTIEALFSEQKRSGTDGVAYVNRTQKLPRSKSSHAHVQCLEIISQ